MRNGVSLRRTLAPRPPRAPPGRHSHFTYKWPTWRRAGGAGGRGRSGALGGPGQRGREGHGGGWQRGPPKTNLDQRGQKANPDIPEPEISNLRDNFMAASSPFGFILQWISYSRISTSCVCTVLHRTLHLSAVQIFQDNLTRSSGIHCSHC